MQFINNSEEIISPLSSAIKGLYTIDIEKLQTEDITLINKNIDDYNTFFTTQQAEFIDYSSFSDHVFFDSAVNKVIFGFNRLLNFPYDLNEFSYKQFINKLEGYTGYLYRNIYPKNKSFINFEGNQKVLIKNLNGAFLNDYEDPKVGVLKPEARFSFNFWLKAKSNNFTNNQTLFKFYNVQNNSGFISFVSFDNNNNGKHYINFLLINDQEYKLEKTEISLDAFANITINVTNLQNKRNISFVIDGNKVENSAYGSDEETSMTANSFHDSLSEVSTEFIFGSSENLTVTLDGQNYAFTNFKGCIDEFRFYHKIKSIKETKREIHKNVFAQEGLVLYLKFNEPGGNYLNSYVCLDSSSNKLHGLILNDSNEIIQDTTNYKVSSDTPLRLERDELSPVVNSSFPDIVTLRNQLLEKAAVFDQKNKNLIFNLMPKHYFLEAGDYQNLPIFSSNDIVKVKEVDGKAIKYLYQPTTDTFKAYQPGNNHFVNMLLIWARFFDQLKIMLDSISTIIDVDYDTINEKKILGLKIPLICKQYGLDFVEIFSSITKRKKNKEALTFNDVVNDFSIRKIQNEIWYKILINSQSFIRSKGTINSIENLMSSVGLNVSDNITIREYSNINNLNNSNDQFISSKTKFKSVNLTNKKLLSTSSTFEESSSFSNEKPYIEVLDLKHFDINDDSIYKDYLVTNQSVKSGLGDNFSIELFFKLESFLKDKTNIASITSEKKNVLTNISNIQNVLRLDYIKSPVLNIFFTRKNLDSSLFTLTADIKPVVNSYLYNFTLVIEDIDLFDRENYICITQSITDTNITYTLYSSKANANILNETLKTSTQTKSINNFNSSNLFSNKSNINLRIGHYHYDNTTTELFSLNNTNFQGEILSIRTWAKSLEVLEIENHVKNIKNISESNISKTSLVNNFSIKEVTEQSAGGIKYFVFDDNAIIKKESGSKSLNECRFNIKSSDNLIDFVKYNEFIIKNKNFSLDTVVKQNKVNIESFNESKNKIITNNFNSFPSNSVSYDHDFIDENRFSIDFSTTKAINDDISRLIASITDFNEVLINNNMYNFKYSNIDKLKTEYFNRIKDDKIVNYSSLANVFRYFDNILSTLLNNMIPSKTKFQGFNLVYESHILERHKYQYKNSDSRVNIYNPSEAHNFSRETNKSYRNNSYNNNRSMINNVPD
jgi:hypothetical protein